MKRKHHTELNFGLVRKNKAELKFELVKENKYVGGEVDGRF